MTVELSVSICSFNINGTKDKDGSLNQKMNDFDILFLQEHLLPAISVNSLRRSSHHIVFTTNARKTKGRPSGGLACVIKRLATPLSPILFHSSDNIMAIRLGHLVFINVYLPCDQKRLASLTKFSNACSSLKTLLCNIEKHGYRWLLIGDFNCDVHSSSTRANLVLDSLPIGYRIVPKALNYSYIHNSGTVTNIDHCICSADVPCSVVNVDEDERDFDHLPLSLTVTLTADPSNHPCAANKKWCMKREWSKANWPLYISTLTALLSCVKIPFNLLCTSVFSPQARVQLNVYYLHLVKCMKQAENVAVPLVRVKLKTRSPIWKEDPGLKAVKNRAKLWLRIWIACGRPLRGQVFDIKSKTKAEFKRYLRLVRYNGAEFPKSAVQWKEVINTSKFDSLGTSDVIPDSSWLGHYKSIFCKIEYSVHYHFQCLISKFLPPKVLQRHVIPVSTKSIVNCMLKLKSKSSDLDGISAHHLRCDCPALVAQLQLLFQFCLSLSMVPDSFLCGTVTSILKRGRDPFDCSSYRPITVACNISKVFEYVLLPYIIERTAKDSNQFGFQPRIGCQHAHKVLASTLYDAQSKGYELHICALDLSKAFDSICHAQMWHSLSEFGVNPSVIHVLKFWYSNSFLRLKSGTGYCGNIPVQSGVRQGGVLSPYLFNACIQNVLLGIKPSYFYNLSDVSYIAYADDLLVLSRTKSILALSVQRISMMFRDVGLFLNFDKCEYLVFNPKSSAHNLSCGSSVIRNVASLRWLGISICSTLTFLRLQVLRDVKEKLKIGYAKIVPNRGKYSRRALAKMYSTYCDHSVLFLSGMYSLLNKNDLRQIRIAYFRYCKFLLYLPTSYRNTRIIEKYGATDIIQSFELLSNNLTRNAFVSLGPNHNIIRVFLSVIKV